MYFILDENKNVVPCKLEEWCDLIEGRSGNKIIKQEEVNGKFVSTVFLGLDHGWGNPKKPVVFETMVFSHPFNSKKEPCEDIYQTRSCTYKQALKHHERAIQWVKDGCKHE
jgi:hypothetical protein